MAEPQVEVDDLSVQFGNVRAISSVSFRVGLGVVGLVGPNGAGKSTLLATLAGVLRPRSGRVVVLGEEVTDRRSTGWRTGVGYLPQRFDLAGGMTVGDTVRYAAWCHGVKRSQLNVCADRALDLVGLGEAGGVRVRRLSGGQRQRLGLAAALAHDPAVVLLDEPTSALDPDQRVQLRMHLATIGAARTVLIATHLLEDVKATASHMMVMAHGRILFDGSPTELEGRARDLVSGPASPLEAGYSNLVNGESTPS